MKVQLIKLQDEFILVSDEEIKAKDNFYDFTLKVINKAWIDFGKHNTCKKIIAGIEQLPSIDFSLLSEDDCRDIGWVDVEKLAVEEHKFNHRSVNEIYFRLGFIVGFQKSQSLNDKMFSLEDMKECLKLYRIHIEIDIKSKSKWVQTPSEFIQSIQQTVWDVEVEMEQENLGQVYNGRNSNTMWSDQKPKITNNAIKIINILC